MVELCSCGKESKYCCPRCKKRTCSLECVKAHKVESDCTGVADKASFVKLSDFDNAQMISDYKFLENIKESIENSQRQLVSEFNGQNRNGIIRKKCIANSTLIKFMPVALSRHQLNQTCCKDDVIRWTIEIIFSDCSTKILAHDVPESWSILDLIEKYKSESVPHSEYRFVSSFFKNDPEVSYFIQAYPETNTFNLLNPESTIMESLKFKAVTEFPTIYITTNQASFKSIECKDFDVKAEMIQLGLLNDGKRKRNRRRRLYKRQKREKSQISNDTCANEDDETDVIKSDNPVGIDETSGCKNNSFKNSVLALFGAEQEKELDVQEASLAPKESEEEGEISS